MRKKIIFMIVIFNLIFNNAYASTPYENYCGNQLKTIGILKGYKDGSLKLDNNIIRSEVATIATRIVNPNGDKVKGIIKKFDDVSGDYWAFNIISDAYNLKIIKGYPDNSFKPKNNISYAEVIAIMVNCLGEADNLKGEWPNNYIDKAKSLGIISKGDRTPPNKIITRGEMSKIVWKSILVKKKW